MGRVTFDWKTGLGYLLITVIGSAMLWLLGQ
jgi:hypothetical protein